MIYRTTHIIKRKEVREHRNTLYLFGDNVIGQGLGEQAKEMRGEVNAIGITTKLYPNYRKESYMSDDFLRSNQGLITADINSALVKYIKGGYKHLVIPPLGLGLAELTKRAPLTFQYLVEELDRLCLAITALEG